MNEKKIIGLVLLTFIIGLVAGYDFGHDWKNSKQNLMKHRQYNIHNNFQKDEDYIDYYYSTQEPANDYVPVTKKINTDTQNPIACTMEAKICPDGSAVGRQGPNCDFAPCPGN